MSVCKCVIWSVNLLQKPGDITWANFCASATTISWRKGTFFNHWHGSTWSPWYGCLFGMFPYKKGLFSDRPKPRIFLRLCIKNFRAARALLFHQTTGPKVLAHCLHFYQFSNHITQFTAIGQSWLSWTPSTKYYKMITTKILDPTKEPHDIKYKS